MTPPPPNSLYFFYDLPKLVKFLFLLLLWPLLFEILVPPMDASSLLSVNLLSVTDALYIYCQLLQINSLLASNALSLLWANSLLVNYASYIYFWLLRVNSFLANDALSLLQVNSLSYIHFLFVFTSSFFCSLFWVNSPLVDDVIFFTYK